MFDEVKKEQDTKVTEDDHTGDKPGDVGLEGFPKFVTKTTEGLYKVTTREKKEFTFKTLKYKELLDIKNIITLNGQKPYNQDKFVATLAVNASVDPKLSREDFENMEGPDGMRLASALVTIYDFDAFL